jgi:cytochrome c-type biogenesis protein CcmF
MHTAWRSQHPGPWRNLFRIPVIIAVIGGVILPVFIYGRVGLLVIVGSIAAVWIVATAVIQPLRSWRRTDGSAGITRAALGMSIAHLGVGFFVIGVTIVSAFGVESDRAMRAGEFIDVGGFQFEMREIRDVKGPNYSAVEGVVEIRQDGEYVGTVRPQKRQYLVQQNWMTEAGIYAGWNKDLFVALGDQIGDGAWSVRIQYKPMIRFIWIGAFIMALGGLVSVSDRRYRQ